MIGIEFGPALTIGHALSYDLAELLPAAEAGMVAALNMRVMQTSP